LLKKSRHRDVHETFNLVVKAKGMAAFYETDKWEDSPPERVKIIGRERS